MTEHDNVALTRRGFDAFANGDLDTLREIIAEDAVWHTGGNNQLSGDYRGIDEILELFMKIFELSGGTFSQDVHDILANEQHTATIVTSTAERAGQNLETKAVLIGHVSDGQLREAWVLNYDQAAVDQFFS